VRDTTIEEIPILAKKYDCEGVAWTYNEPTIWFEFTIDGCRTAKKYGLYTVYVTNGYINEPPLREIAQYLDAMNIDVKAFRDDFYHKVSKGRLQPVLATCNLAKKLNIHIELTYLVIPTYNDHNDELTDFCKWVFTELGAEIPVHFSRFHPDYKMRHLHPTPLTTLDKAYKIAKSVGLKYVYLGNVPHSEKDNTYCPNCSMLLVERYGFYIDQNRIRNSKCPNCGTKISIIMKKRTAP
jgi:pyruvate formate lyase activating enzyme